MAAPERRQARADKSLCRTNSSDSGSSRYLKLLVPLESCKPQAAGPPQALVVSKSIIRPPLTNAHKQKLLHWAQTCIKTNFQSCLPTSAVELWSRWMEKWTATMSQKGCDVSKEVAERGFFGQNNGKRSRRSLKVSDWPRSFHAFHRKIIFMHDAAKNTSVALTAMSIKEKLVVMPLFSTDLNPTENLRYTRVGGSLHQTLWRW